MGEASEDGKKLFGTATSGNLLDSMDDVRTWGTCSVEAKNGEVRREKFFSASHYFRLEHKIEKLERGCHRYCIRIKSIICIIMMMCWSSATWKMCLNSFMVKADVGLSQIDGLSIDFRWKHWPPTCKSFYFDYLIHFCIHAEIRPSYSFLRSLSVSHWWSLYSSILSQTR